jgi:hypothetical protein
MSVSADAYSYRNYDNNALSSLGLILSERLPILKSPKRKQGCLRYNEDSEVSTMKLATLIVAAALAVPAVSSFAQSQPLTRGEVKAQLVQAERAGYNPNGDRTSYPAEIQAADARIAAQSGQNGYGGVMDGSSAAGGYRAPAHTGNSVTPVYFGH